MLSLITGVGAKGQVGEAVALALGKRGDTVLVVSRSSADATARASELTAAGCAAFGYGCDLASASDVEVLRQHVIQQHGERLDALVNLAGGFGSLGPVAQSDPGAFEHQLRINLMTAYLTTRAFLPAVQRARGAIVFFASETSLENVPTRGVAAYAAAKAGVVALMRSVADEGRESGLRSNALAPAAIRTATNEAAMGADARFVEREDVASVVAYLCSPASAAISGQILRLRK